MSLTDSTWSMAAAGRRLLPLGTIALALAARAATAAPGYTLPTSGSTGILADIETSMGELASFITEPLGVFVVICAFILAAGMWIFAPRSGAMAVAFRAVAALLVVFNLTAFIAYFTYGTA